MENPISISYKTITYGRVNLLEEAIESFLRQEYEGESEMLIVNDYEKQTLYFDHPKIRIINLKETFKTIGQKENFTVENCKYNTIAIADDDDIFLPNHSDNINKYFPGYDLLHWQNSVAMVSKEIKAIHSIGNAGIVYTKEIWEKVGKHDHYNAGYDSRFISKIHAAGGKVAKASPENKDVSYFYNWGVSYHMSGLGSDQGRPEQDQVVERHKRHIEHLRLQGKIPTGDIGLLPHWNYNYEKMLKDYIAKK